MSLQRSVAQQNAEVLAEIRRTAEHFASGQADVQWLHGLLQSHELSSGQGVLAKLSARPDQSGTLYEGLWLSSAKEFWRFVVLVPRSGDGFAEVEAFENVTRSVVVSGRVPGIGRSFGFLAHQVLHEARVG
jgi:hypothetical protein